MSTLYHGNCLVEMGKIEDGSVDLIAADLPFSVTACKWDKLIPFKPLWAHFKRVLKPRGVVVANGVQPFTTDLIMSNREWFKYCWYWRKSKGTGHLNVKKQPLRNCEDIAVFYNKQCAYHPQMTDGEPYKNKAGRDHTQNNSITDCYGAYTDFRYDNDGVRYPTQLLEITEVQRGTLNPTQKPEELLEYILKTYTNPGDLVLDPVMGSGTTGAAAANLDRQFIGIELDDHYFSVASERIEKAERAARQIEMELI